MKTKYITTILITTTLTVFPAHVFAESTIVNIVSVSSDSGGNSAKEGEVVSGDSRSSVHINTTVNNKTVTKIDKTSTEGSIEVAEIIHLEDDEILHIPHTPVPSTENVFKSEYQKAQTVVATPQENQQKIHRAGDSTRYKKHLLFIRFFINYSKTMAYVLPHFF